MYIIKIPYFKINITYYKALTLKNIHRLTNKDLFVKKQNNVPYFLKKKASHETRVLFPIDTRNKYKHLWYETSSNNSSCSIAFDHLAA